MSEFYKSYYIKKEWEHYWWILYWFQQIYLFLAIFKDNSNNYAKESEKCEPGKCG